MSNDRGELRGLAEDSIFIDPLFGPWNTKNKTTVFILCKGVDETAIRATLGSVFSASVQNLAIYCIGLRSDLRQTIFEWTATDGRVIEADTIPKILPDSGSILVIPGGCILTKYSLEALIQTLSLPSVEVVRSTIDGLRGTIELWHAAWLSKQTDISQAEYNSHKLGLELWISPENIGIHSYDSPEPKVFFGRGAADRHILEVVAYDARSKLFIQSKERQIASLKRELSHLREGGNKNSKRLRLGTWRATRYAKRIIRMLSGAG